MSEHHEPKIISDAKELAFHVGLLIFLGIVLAAVFGGMVSFVFKKRFREYAEKWAQEDADKGHGTYEYNLREWSLLLNSILVIWFVLSWAFFIYAMRH
jgi:hypothetical protein